MSDSTQIAPVESRLDRLIKARPYVAEVPAAQVWLQTLGEGTARSYGRDVDEWLRFLHKECAGLAPGAVTTAQMERWIRIMESEGVARSTVARRYAAVRGWYDWLRRETSTEGAVRELAGGVVTADVSVGRGRAPKVHAEHTQKLGLDRSQTREVLVAADHYGPRAVALVTLLAVCGVRISEALDADVTGIREQRGHRTLDVMGKGRKPRTVVLPPRVWHAIETYLGGRDSGPIFVTSTGRRLDRQAAYDTIARIGRRAGVDLHPHLLRHTAATAALDAGAPLDQVQDLLGHSSPVITKRYVQARQRLDSSAAYAVASWLDD